MRVVSELSSSSFDLPEWLRLLVTEWQVTAFDLDKRERALRVELESAAPQHLPKGIGALTWVILAREICNWARFQNRRQVASYTGLCPGIHSRRFDGNGARTTRRLGGTPEL